MQLTIPTKNPAIVTVNNSNVSIIQLLKIRQDQMKRLWKFSLAKQQK
ncbi:hypothetical protein SAMN05421797_10513 [Maribacter ulvicola]|uniref:Uncharacterized protein n=1 Tax=Maribacter ulvicola TaxID=228959 RepID=A0A1N6X799_9FLAO|nr:hypothetical protein SAMN05421797_10513 [Maribacter ulvicola]